MNNPTRDTTPSRAPCAALRAGLLLIAVALTLSGCSMFGLFGGGGDRKQKPQERIRVKSVSLAMSSEANDRWPVRVELVRVRDERLAEALLRIETANWFGAEGDGFHKANPQAIYDEWEVVPGTAIGPFKIRKRGRFAGVLFCGTREPRPPERIARRGDMMIYVDDEGCNVSKRESSKRSWWKLW